MGVIQRLVSSHHATALRTPAFCLIGFARDKRMRKFHVNVWAKDGNLGVRPIGSVEEAKVFLEGWPAAERSPLYHVAANRIDAAEADSVTPDLVADALIEFLAEEGALAEERCISEVKRLLAAPAGRCWSKHICQTHGNTSHSQETPLGCFLAWLEVIDTSLRYQPASSRITRFRYVRGSSYTSLKLH